MRGTESVTAGMFLPSLLHCEGKHKGSAHAATCWKESGKCQQDEFLTDATTKKIKIACGPKSYCIKVHKPDFDIVCHLTAFLRQNIPVARFGIL